MSHSGETGKIHPALATIIVIVLIGIVASVAIAVQGNLNDQNPEQTTQNQTSNPSSQSSSGVNDNTDTSDYRDGTYSATGSYVSPGGRESIELTVTIENGIITSTQLQQNATDREAREYQAAFASGYSELVVGKNVDEVSLSRVAGSSLTSNGFNNALDQIKDDAAA
jgi:uncharacterized protein with FMN-binding domain